MSKALDARRKQIQAMLREEKEIAVHTFAQHFKISEETIRKDLIAMETQGLLIRKHGKAKGKDFYLELPIDMKANENAYAKQAIAHRALAFIEDNRNLYLDPSTTNLYVAKFLHLRKDLTIITNSLAIALEASHTPHHVIVLGGKLASKAKATSGAFVTQMIDALQIDIALMGSDGFQGVDGPTTFAYEQLDLKQKVMKKAKQKLLLCDASKFDKQASYRYAPFHDFNAIITDHETIEETHPIRQNSQLIVLKK